MGNGGSAAAPFDRDEVTTPMPLPGELRQQQNRGGQAGEANVLQHFQNNQCEKRSVYAAAVKQYPGVLPILPGITQRREKMT